MNQNKSETPEEYAQRQLRSAQAENRELHATVAFQEKKIESLKVMNNDLRESHNAIVTKSNKQASALRASGGYVLSLSTAIVFLALLFIYLVREQEKLQVQNRKQQELIINYQAKESAKTK